MSDANAQPSPRESTAARTLGEALLVGVLALCVRLTAAWALGEGAPFGPDGTGAEAAVHLGGHLYPLHIELIRLFGDGRTLSIFAGTASVVLLYGIGVRTRLTGRGAWFAAALPLAVYTSALTAGDAPALCVVLLGVFIATGGHWSLELLGGALAMSSVAVKPVALPALTLLLLRPWSLLGAAATLPWTLPWLDPLFGTRPRGGLLGTWWPAVGGAMPVTLADVSYVIRTGAASLWSSEHWVGVWLVPVAAVGALAPPPPKAPDVGVGPRLVVVPLLLGLVVVAGGLGDASSPRTLTAALVPLCLYAGVFMPRVLALALLVPAAALVSQVADIRRDLDRDAQVPHFAPLELPRVDARTLFDESSTRDATRMRAEARQLAESLPQGATVTVKRRPHGREGELVWPLLVARPDVQIERRL